MSHDAASNKLVVQRFVRDAMDRASGEWNPAVIAEVFDVERYFSHTWGAGLVETGRRMAEFFSAFAPIERLNDVYVAEGDFVIHRVTLRARHVGAVLGVAATNRELTLHHVDMWRLADGKIVEHWGGLGEAQNLFIQITS